MSRKLNTCWDGILSLMCFGETNHFTTACVYCHMYLACVVEIVNISGYASFCVGVKMLLDFNLITFTNHKVINAFIF